MSVLRGLIALCGLVALWQAIVWATDAPRFILYIRNTALRYRELAPLLRLIDKVEGWEAASGFAYGRM